MARVALFFLLLAASPTPDELEMARLQAASEEALANNDPSGAALFSGRAALMAGQLAIQQSDERERAWLRGKESLFRAQERIYRALAMYKLGGGMPPASAGVCGMIDQGAGMAETAVRNVRGAPGTEQMTPDWQVRLRDLEDSVADLGARAKAIRHDVQCP